jgi:AcrR family transcriptional regulator
MVGKAAKPSHDLMLRVRRAFLDHGYSNLSMIGLAKVCGFTRRSLYHYFSSKEDAFQSLTDFDNRVSIEAGFEAGRRAQKNGGSALDILAEIMDVRYGNLRREVYMSPHAVELNAEAFRRSWQIMVGYAEQFHAQLAEQLIAMQRDGLMTLRQGITPEHVAKLLANGARGVNQSLPPIPPDDLAPSYRAMCEAVLYGCATPPNAG